MLDFGHPVTFNEFVGDTDEDGQRVDRQFRYYPGAQPKPVLVTDGGVGQSEAAMQEESIAHPDGGTAITEDTDHELLAFYWQATAKYREHHDAVARGDKPPVIDTPDGNPPREDIEEPPPPNMNGDHFTRTEQGPGTPSPSTFDTPTAEQPPIGLPTVEVDVQTFTDMQRQLVIGELQPLIDHQDMVIQSQCILLSKSLDPDSPHHEIMEMWMDKLEAMRFKLYGSPTGFEDPPVPETAA